MKSPDKSASLLVILFCMLVTELTTGCSNDSNLESIDESYKPEKPIEFPHDIHTGKNGIDCKYCHNSEFDANNTGIPAAEVCSTCHKQINGNQTTDSTGNR